MNVAIIGTVIGVMYMIEMKRGNICIHLIDVSPFRHTL
jgi:hypothetical protein